MDSWEANRKLSQALPLLKKGEKKKEKRSLCYCYEAELKCLDVLLEEV